MDFRFSGNNEKTDGQMHLGQPIVGMLVSSTLLVYYSYFSCSFFISLKYMGTCICQGFTLFAIDICCVFSSSSN